MRTAAASAVAAIIFFVVAAGAATAQDPRLERRLDPATRAAVTAIIDAARADRLPTEPLVDRALEGATKHADAGRIVSAVRLLADELVRARTALGASSSVPELVAGASALRAGVRPTDLTELRQRRSHSLTVALAALTDLVASGVPVDSAATAVLAIAARARDDQIGNFRRAVESDIALGAPPAAATAVRVNAAIQELSDASTRSQNPTRRP